MKAVQINLMDIVEGTATNVQGCILRYQLEKHIQNEDKVILSLMEATPLSSSFLNSSLGELIDNYGYEKIANSLSFKNVTKFNGATLKKYFEYHKNYA